MGNQISVVMAAIKPLLPAQKTAWVLHCLTGQPLSTCQKLLSGHRRENRDMLAALIAGPHGWEVVRAIVAAAIEAGAAAPDWFAECTELQDLHQVERELARARRQLARRRRAAVEKGNG